MASAPRSAEYVPTAERGSRGADPPPPVREAPWRPAASLDHLVGAGEERRRNGQAKRLRGFDIDHQFKSGRLFDRVGCWMFLALENVIDEDRRSTEHRAHACAVAQETTRPRQLSPRRYYGRPRRLCPFGDAKLQREKDGRSGDDDSLALGLHDRSQHAFQIVDAFDVPYLQLNTERSCGVLS